MLHLSKNHLLAAAIVTAMGFSSLPVQAYEKGDFILRAGIASLQPEEEPFGTLATLNAGVEKDEQLGITFSYMLSNHWALGVLASTPFEHEITSNGTRIGETKLLPPTFSLEYFPASSQSALQPFIGLGVNYTTFFSEESTLGDIDFDDSVGVSFEVGLDYKVSENLITNITIWNIDVETDATLNGTSIGGVDIDPWNYMLALGYIF